MLARFAAFVVGPVCFFARGRELQQAASPAPSALPPPPCTMDEALRREGAILVCSPVDCLARYGTTRPLFDPTVRFCAVAAPSPTSSPVAAPVAPATPSPNPQPAQANCSGHGTVVCATLCTCSCDAGWRTSAASAGSSIFGRVFCDVPVGDGDVAGQDPALNCSGDNCATATEALYISGIVGILVLAVGVIVCLGKRCCCPDAEWPRCRCTRKEDGEGDGGRRHTDRGKGAPKHPDSWVTSPPPWLMEALAEALRRQVAQKGGPAGVSEGQGRIAV